MRILLNLLWIICGGLLSALGWWITGLLWCITIIGIPVGLQCFKLASVSLNPFGKEVINRGGAGSLLLNILWIIFGGLGLAISNALLGLLLCVTIIGIPFGLQFFKIARVALTPFGAEVEREHVF
ncbi:MAG: YccF domain-containing protein [Lachnospiraceae bacterium]|nr:YccF domain-containing protein [Lachnospiraceae bacterium]